MSDLLVGGATVVTMDAHRRILRNGAIAIREGRIVEVGPTSDLRSRHQDIQYLDATNRIALPGFVDAHHHCSQTYAKGLADDCTFWDWCYKWMFPYDACLEAEDVYWGALYAGMQLLRTGTTCFADPGGPFPEALARGIEDVGIRGLLSFHTWDRTSKERPLPPGVRSPSVEEAIEATTAFMDTWDGQANGRIRVTPAVRTVVNATSDLLMAMAQLAQSRGTIVQMHAAVCDEHNRWVLDQTGLSPIEYLSSLGLLDVPWLLAHCARLTEHEVELMAAGQVRVAHCPGSSMHSTYGAVSSGRFPELVASGVPIALGTDAVASNNRIDMFQEMFLVSGGQKDARRTASIFPPELTLELATIKGAAALSIDDEVGSLEVKKRGDLVLLDRSAEDLIPWREETLVPNLVYCGGKQLVQEVIIDGRVVLVGGQILTANEDRVRHEVQTRAERVMERMAVMEERKASLWPWTA